MRRIHEDSENFNKEAEIEHHRGEIHQWTEEYTEGFNTTVKQKRISDHKTEAEALNKAGKERKESKDSLNDLC